MNPRVYAKSGSPMDIASAFDRAVTGHGPFGPLGQAMIYIPIAHDAVGAQPHLRPNSRLRPAPVVGSAPVVVRAPARLGEGADATRISLRAMHEAIEALLTVVSCGAKHVLFTKDADGQPTGAIVYEPKRDERNP